jgi:glycerol-3-phosphate acyltransferase PlsX
VPEGRVRVAFALEDGAPRTRRVLEGALRGARSPDAEAVFFGEIAEAAREVVERRADALACACAGAAAHAAALAAFKRIPGVLRPALAWPFPSPRGPVLLADAGPNPDCKPWHLLQFAIMGAIYAREVLGREDPSVGLLGPEPGAPPGAGSSREALALLKFSGLRFIGPISAAALPAGEVDVAVCDGLCGHACRSLLEGLRLGWEGRIGGPSLRRSAAEALLPGLRGALSDLGGGGAAPILGVDAPAVCLASLDPGSAAEALSCAAAMHRRGLNGAIRGAIEAFESRAASGGGLAGAEKL